MSQVSSIIYTIQNTRDAPNSNDILDYMPFTFPTIVLMIILEVTYYWLMVVLLTGAFLPVFSKEY